MNNEENEMIKVEGKEINEVEESKTEKRIVTNIEDFKTIVNIENKVDVKLNDCEGVTIEVEEYYIKQYRKELKEPIVNEETGEILKTHEYTNSLVFIDKEGKSYATGSKVFTIQFLRYLQLKEELGVEEEPTVIKIIKKPFGEKNNKALSFEVI